jgi:predicted ATPase
VALARSLNHSTTLADTVAMSLFVATFTGDLTACDAAASEVLELSTSEKLQDYADLAKAARGWILAEQGEAEAGLALVRHAAPILMDQGDPWKPSLMGLCALVLGRHATGEEAVELLDVTLAQGRDNEVHWWDAELYRIKGDLLLTSGARGADDGEDSLLRALDIARQQEAKSLELRASASLARLWHDRGRESEARDLLQPIVAWFPDDPAFADLTAAKRLLAGLDAR